MSWLAKINGMTPRASPGPKIPWQARGFEPARLVPEANERRGSMHHIEAFGRFLFFLNHSFVDAKNRRGT